MKPSVLIVNPTSGQNSPPFDLAELLAAAHEILGDTVVSYTTRRGHARELAAKAAREAHDLVIAVGGDGTFSEVVNGVLETSSPDQTDPAGIPAVGLVHAGTGGDFRRSLGVGPSYRECLEAIALGRERPMDVGRASFIGLDGEPVQQHFVNVLSTGLGGLVDRYVASSSPLLPGRLAYYLASLRAVAVGREREIVARITWEGKTREEIIPAYLIAICNGRWFGSGMDIAPMALTDDGRFEVLTVTERNRLYLAAKIRKVYKGRHLEEETVCHFPCHRIELRLAEETAKQRCLIDVDGDYQGWLPLEVEIVPKRLRIRA